MIDHITIRNTGKVKPRVKAKAKAKAKDIDQKIDQQKTLVSSTERTLRLRQQKAVDCHDEVY